MIVWKPDSFKTQVAPIFFRSPASLLTPPLQLKRWTFLALTFNWSLWYMVLVNSPNNFYLTCEVGGLLDEGKKMM